jgi:hypothetical protein
MPEVGQNIEHWRGNSLTIEIKISDQSGNPINVTSAEGKWCMARNAQAKAAGDVFVQKNSDTAGGGIVIEPITSDPYDYMIVTLHPIDTENLIPGNYYHEAEIVDGAGNIYTVCVGKFKLQPAVLPPYSP